MTSSPSFSKILNDPIHGHISIPDYCLEFIDTEQFQRLRSLKQLGTSYFVFPGAVHTRFEHSIGVAYLSGQLLRKFQNEQKELEISDKEIQLVELSGLCHDLGHGPFSHAFEDWARKIGKTGWNHELMSQELLNLIIDENSLDYSAEEKRFMNTVINPPKQPHFHEERAFLYQIVSNSTNSIDVDKFDYLTRDSYMTGLKFSYDSSRLMKFNRVVENEICFEAKESYNLYELFHTRYSLFKQVYTHRVSKAIEYMIGDAFTEANASMRISEALDDPHEYCKLTDTLLQQIEYSRDPSLKSAQEIIRRIRRRDLYKFVDEVILPSDPDHFMNGRIPQLSETDLANRGAGSLRPQDVIVQHLAINYARGNDDPVKVVKFFDRRNPLKSFTIEKSTVSATLPVVFKEDIVRVFCRDPKKAEEVQAAFNDWLDASGLIGKSRSNTPFTSPQRPEPRNDISEIDKLRRAHLF